MSALAAVAGLRLREALAGRTLWLVPIHFAVALPLAASIPGRTPEDRAHAADAAALALAAVLGLVAAAVIGGTPLPGERERPRGALLLASGAGPGTRSLGAALGAGAALLLLLAGLLASALAAAELGAGAPPLPRVRVRPSALVGGAPDPRHAGAVWLTERAPRTTLRFEDPPAGPSRLTMEARPRLSAGARPEGAKSLRVRVPGPGGERAEVLQASLDGAFTVLLPGGTRALTVERPPGAYDLGLRPEGCWQDGGERPRALARALHAAALAGGLLAVLAAALALSTVAGSGVAAAGAGCLALLALSRGTFEDGARTLEARLALHPLPAGHPGGVPGEGVPPALAPLFRLLAGVLPDGGRFDLSADLVRGAVPDGADVLAALALGLALAAGFTLLAAAGSRRRR